NVDSLAVRSKSDPGRSATSRGLSRHGGIRQRDMSQQLEIRERVSEYSIGRPAVGPQGFVVRGYIDAMADALAPWRKPCGFVGILDSRHFFVCLEIHYRESVRSIQV